MNMPDAPDHFAEAELLILPNGTLLVHNLTPAAAAVLAELNPADSAMLQRVMSASRPHDPKPAQGGQPGRSPDSPAQAEQPKTAPTRCSAT